MEIAARRARVADLAEIAALVVLARAELAGQRSGAIHLDSELDGGTAPDELPAKEEAYRLLAVGEIDGVVVGYLDASLVPVAGGRCRCRVAALYVAPSAREVGVGEELVAYTTDWARAAGADGIDVAALPGARETKNFFESTGFVARLIVMHRGFA